MRGKERRERRKGEMRGRGDEREGRQEGGETRGRGGRERERRERGTPSKLTSKSERLEATLVKTNYVYRTEMIIC
jgi:hypothetical protein